MIKLLAALLLPALLASCSVVGARDGYEEPPYEVAARLGESTEVRRYDARLAVEAIVASDGETSGRNKAFRLLFDYISGKNEAAAQIDMTTPVETGQEAEKIAMTVPVETDATGSGEVRMRFFLPGSYTAETAPRPLDPSVKLITLPAQTMAVLRFSGSTGEPAVAARKKELLAALEKSTWRTSAAPIAYFYDPPWTLPPFRRNEVAVRVETADSNGSDS